MTKDDATSPSEWPFRSAAPGGTTPLVYVVDDEAASVELVSALLQRDGYRTQGFQSPVAAISAVVAATPKPSLLISDFAMPEMDGVLLMRRCKHLWPGLRVILLSGTVSAELLRECGLGPDLVLEKPVSLMRLAAAVEALIGRVPQV